MKTFILFFWIAIPSLGLAQKIDGALKEQLLVSYLSPYPEGYERALDVEMMNAVAKRVAGSAYSRVVFCDVRVPADSESCLERLEKKQTDVFLISYGGKRKNDAFTSTDITGFIEHLKQFEVGTLWLPWVFAAYDSKIKNASNRRVYLDYGRNGVEVLSALAHGKDLSESSVLESQRVPDGTGSRSDSEGETGVAHLFRTLFEKLYFDSGSDDSSFSLTLPELYADAMELACRRLRVVYGADEFGETTIPGGDVRVVLKRAIPHLDDYIDKVLEKVASIQLSFRNGRTRLQLVFDEPLNFFIRQKKEAGWGQLYLVQLRKNVEISVGMQRDALFFEKIMGIDIFVKLPVLPDRAVPRALYLDTANERLTASVGLLGDRIEVLGRADIRARKFEGIDWISTLSRNWLTFFSNLGF